MDEYPRTYEECRIDLERGWYVRHFRTTGTYWADRWTICYDGEGFVCTAHPATKAVFSTALEAISAVSMVEDLRRRDLL